MEVITISLTSSAVEDSYRLDLVYSNGSSRSTTSVRLARSSSNNVLGATNNLGVWTVNEAGGKDKHHLKVNLQGF
jgi:hypothetical protein